MIVPPGPRLKARFSVEITNAETEPSSCSLVYFILYSMPLLIVHFKLAQLFKFVCIFLFYFYDIKVHGNREYESICSEPMTYSRQ